MTTTDFSDTTATFGDRLAAARQSAGIKRKPLAQQIGVKPSTMRSWEENRSEPRANRLTIMAGILGVSLVWLMTGEGAGPFEDEADDNGVAAHDGDDDDGVDATVVALAKDFAAVRAELTAANRRLAGIERRLKRLQLE